MKRSILTIICFVFFIQANAQMKVKLAQKHFNDLAYVRAAPIYEELADRYLNKKEGYPRYILRAAIANEKIRNYKKAVEYYKKYLKSAPNEMGEEDFFSLIQDLRILQQYKSSVTIAKKALVTYPENVFFQLISEKGNHLEEIKAKGKFNVVEKMPFNSGEGDFAPTFFHDTLFYASRAFHRGFLSGRYSWDKKYFTKVAYTYKNKDEWQKPKVMNGLFLTRKHDGPITFSPDGKMFILTKDLGKEVVKKKNKMHHLGLFISTKDSLGNWGELEKFPFSPKSSNNGLACFTPNGKRIYFVSDRLGGSGKTDIYYSDYKNGQWQQPVNFKAINTKGREMFPFVSKDNKLYFASDGYLGLGGLDIYSINLNSGDFTPINMGANINTAADDFGLIVTNDSISSGYFSSNRKDFIDRIYSWKNTAPSIRLIVKVQLDYTPPQPLPDQEIWLTNSTLADSVAFITNAAGEISSGLTANNDYVIHTQKNGKQLNVKFNTNGITKDTTLKYVLHIKPLYATVKIHVFNKKSKEPIKDAMVTISGIDSTFITNDKGNIISRVEKGYVYQTTGDRDGYMINSLSFSTNKEKWDFYVDLPLTKIEKGLSFKLKNVYYDYDKATLRTESKKALDKVAQFIKKNHVKVELSAHTDSRGSDAYNMNLSQRRAESCVRYLVKKGISRSMLVAKGYGETRPVNGCVNGVPCTKEQYQENRRTEIKILKVVKK